MFSLIRSSALSKHDQVAGQSRSFAHFLYKRSTNGMEMNDLRVDTVVLMPMCVCFEPIQNGFWNSLDRLKIYQLDHASISKNF